MDLNIIIYDNGFEIEKSIVKNIECCYKFNYKKIALAINLGENNLKIPIPPKLNFNHPDLKIYTRLTVKMKDGLSFHKLIKHENLKYYDLLAIEPKNETTLNLLYNNLHEFDILTFSEFNSDIVSMIKKAHFSMPITKGIGIEINYSNCLSSSSQRQQAIAFGQLLVDKTNSKNIILSSGTNLSSHIRSPRDVIYMGLLFGLEDNKSKKAVYQNPISVIKHSELRKNMVTSIIEICDENVYEELKKKNTNQLPGIPPTKKAKLLGT